MKTTIICLFIALTTTTMAELEYGSLIGSTQSITIASGETFTLLANNFNERYPSSTDIKVYSPPSNETYVSLQLYKYSSYHLKNAVNPNFGIIAGPCKIQLSGADGYCSYKITRHEVTASPMNIIALPSDNNGDVDVLVEASTDLITWTPIYSGSAGTSNNAAFFRTRLITQ